MSLPTSKGLYAKAAELGSAPKSIMNLVALKSPKYEATCNGD